MGVLQYLLLLLLWLLSLQHSGLDYATLRVAAPNSESCASHGSWSCICWLCLSCSHSLSLRLRLRLSLSFSTFVPCSLGRLSSVTAKSSTKDQKGKAQAKSECQSGRSNQQANLLTCRAKRPKKSEPKAQVSDTNVANKPLCKRLRPTCVILSGIGDQKRRTCTTAADRLLRSDCHSTLLNQCVFNFCLCVNAILLIYVILLSTHSTYFLGLPNGNGSCSF